MRVALECNWKVENKCNDGVTGERTLLHHRQVLRRVHPERVALEYSTAQTKIQRTEAAPLSKHWIPLSSSTTAKSVETGKTGASGGLIPPWMARIATRRLWVRNASTIAIAARPALAKMKGLWAAATGARRICYATPAPGTAF